MLKYEVMAMNSLLRLKEQGKEALQKFFTDEEGEFIHYRKDFVIATGGINLYESDDVASRIPDTFSNQYIAYQFR